MTKHKSLTLPRILAAVEESMRETTHPCFCIFCGEETKVDRWEGAIRQSPCNTCNQLGVYGAEELLMMVSA